VEPVWPHRLDLGGKAGDGEADGRGGKRQAPAIAARILNLLRSMPPPLDQQRYRALTGAPRRYGRALEQVGVHAVHSVGTRQVERHDAADHQRDAKPLCGGERLVQQQHPDHGDCRGASA
jgi:hypothetical protein